MQDFCCWWENCLATPTLLPTQDMGGGGGGGGVSKGLWTQFSFFIKLGGVSTVNMSLESGSVVFSMVLFSFQWFCFLFNGSGPLIL